jgi:hypothetical protein
MWKNVIITDETANLNDVRQTHRLNVGAVEAVGYVMDINLNYTSHVMASLKQNMCCAEGHNYYLDTEIHKCIILYYNNMKISTFN